MDGLALGTWEAVLVGVLVVVLLLWLGPGVRESVKRSPRGTWQDWQGVLVPLAVVVLFVFLLISLA